MTAALDTVARQHVGHAPGNARATCPSCGKSAKDRSVNVTINTDGSAVAHCHRCEENGIARPNGSNGAKRPAKLLRTTRPPEDHAALWESGAEPGEACEHPYLIQRQVNAYGIRIAGEMLLIPMCNAFGALVGVQKIDAEGRKLYTKGARKTGAYHLIGAPDGRIIIAEGYATGASIHEATGIATAIAFDAGNLIQVAKALGTKYPNNKIIIGADDDAMTAGNPGITKATEAALAVGGLLAVPDFGADRPEGATDFNDLSRLPGPEAIAACIAKAKAPEPDDHASASLPRPSYIIHESASTALLTSNYAVKGIIDLQSQVLIYGASYSGKTFFALDLHLHVAHGMPWRGRRVRKCLVLYIAAEAGASLQRRVRAWLDHHHVDAASGAFWIRQRGISLMELDAADQIEAELSTVDNLDELPIIIVVDTLSRSLAGGDENRDLPTAIGVCDRLRDRLKATLVLVHHTGKDTDRGPRGHSSLFAAADTSLCVQELGGNRAAIIDKARDSVHGTTLPFTLRPVELGTDDDGDIISTCIVEHQADEAGQVRDKGKVRRDVALDALHETISEFGERLPQTSTIPPGVKGTTLDQWRKRWELRTGYEGESARVNFYKDCQVLLKAAAIIISKPYVWITGN